MWRIAPDATDSFPNMLEISDVDSELAAYSGPHNWNDPDVLQVGRSGMSFEEYRTHMTLWAMLSAPILAGVDLRKIATADLDLLTNADVIAISQDPRAEQAQRLQHGNVDVWLKTLSGGWAVALINRSQDVATYVFSPSDLGIPPTHAYDVWNKKSVNTPYSVSIEPHCSILLKLE
jgi:alpha-galactosidase